jgi:flagellar basal-body rod protein FlgB
MASPFDNPLGLSAAALPLREARMQLIASNLANADTPGFKARDIDFAQTLQALADGMNGGGAPGAGPGPAAMQATHPLHVGAAVGPGMGTPGGRVHERDAVQPSLDGNTVNAEVENAAFARAALEYRASLSFVEGRVRSLLTAITGQ